MAGKFLSSSTIDNMDKCSNFEDPLRYLDVVSILILKYTTRLPMTSTGLHPKLLNEK
jgi:hypothetical protein